MSEFSRKLLFPACKELQLSLSVSVMFELFVDIIFPSMQKSSNYHSVMLLC